MLAADLQEQVLALEAVDGAEPMAERTLREVAHAGTWAEQRKVASRFFSTQDGYCRQSSGRIPCARAQGSLEQSR